MKLWEPNELVSRFGQIGAAKRDPRVFEILLMKLKSAPENALMIGDRLVTDIQGAQNAGMRAVWINRSGKAANRIIKPDREISSLDELPAIVESRRGMPHRRLLETKKLEISKILYEL